MSDLGEDKLKNEAEAFDNQLLKRIKNGHIPDLRRSGRCEYFYNNVWRDQEFVNLHFGEVVTNVTNSIVKYLDHTTKKEIRILEVGCGPGHVSLELSRNGFDVTGIDISKVCIEEAKKIANEDIWKKERGKLSYIQEDFLKQNGEFDVILFISSLHHFSNCQHIVDHAKELLTSNGLIIVNEPVVDQVTTRNAALVLLVRGILSATSSYFQEFNLPQEQSEIEELIKKIYHEEKYELEDGTKVQSVNDNESGYEDMYPVLIKSFQELEHQRNYAFFHRLIGGIRLETIEKEHKIAKFIKMMDSVLCEQGALDPTNFYFVGMKKSNNALFK